ncbi:MAG: ABC transporter ATP-binding protein [Bacteroidetes bacterium]|nr:MAG: ABC transporter ATP-binding protein [Bacteroidota bacterium]
MAEPKPKGSAIKSQKPNMMKVLSPYRGMIVWLIVLALLGNGINLLLPKLISHGIDSYMQGHFDMQKVILQFSLAALGIFIFTFLQSVVQTYASEKVARDLRTQLSEKISKQSFAYIQKANPSKLLTNLTSDIDSIKLFVSMAIVSIASSLCIIIGASALLLSINWKLGIAVITIIPIIGGTFFIVLKKVRALFMKGREVIDRLNKVINESILGAATIRVLHSEKPESEKFREANAQAKDIGISILKLFSLLIPIITFTASMAGLTILMLGGHFVITGSMTIGEMAAFSSYLMLLIFPILVIGFMSNVIAQASASYSRINEVLQAPELKDPGTITEILRGDIELKNITVTYGEKPALKNISFKVDAGSRTAVIGPTAAGKTQLLYLLTGLIKPNEGEILLDGKNIEMYDKESFHQQTGFVFQDSIIFNLSVRENIAFNEKVTDDLMQKAIDTAEITDFVNSLPEKLETIVSERGSSLSGGQKQRIMLARALAIDPRILLLDDFTARVDNRTEQKILQNLKENYPGLTLISVTQKIASVENYDQIVLIMEGELIAKGRHEELMANCPEYIQIYESQRSTSL